MNGTQTLPGWTATVQLNIVLPDPQKPQSAQDAGDDAARAHATAADRIRASCVLLTLGDRPQQLERAVQSVLTQDGPPVEVVVVANGPTGARIPAGARLVVAGHNLGVPGGRNLGTDACDGDFVLYLDDDGWLPDPSSVRRLREAFARERELGVVTFRILDPETGRTERRHVPRLRVGDPARSGEVTTFLGGACAVRRRAIEECGPFPEGFFYAHEETDFAWRALDRGYRIRYDATIVMHHPGGSAAARHEGFWFHTARNRVWLARRRLPAPLAVAYLVTWTVLTVVRAHRVPPLRAAVRGFLDGIRTDPGPREPISWRTAAVMLRRGRPPVV